GRGGAGDAGRNRRHPRLRPRAARRVAGRARGAWARRAPPRPERPPPAPRQPDPGRQADAPEAAGPLLANRGRLSRSSQRSRTHEAARAPAPPRRDPRAALRAARACAPSLTGATVPEPGRLICDIARALDAYVG